MSVHSMRTKTRVEGNCSYYPRYPAEVKHACHIKI